MSDRRTVNIVCAKRLVRSGCVPVIRYTDERYEAGLKPHELVWKCSFCGARVKVVA